MCAIPSPIHADASTVAATDTAVDAPRAAYALEQERDRKRQQESGQHPLGAAHSRADDRGDSAREPRQRDRPQRPEEAEDLMERDRGGHDGQDRQPPSPEVHEREHRGQ